MTNTPFAATSAINSITDLMLGIDKPMVLHTKPIGGKGEIKSQNIPLLIEFESNGVLDYYIFPRTTESLKYTHQTRSSVVHTQAGGFSDIIGMLPPKIQLSGTFGYYGTARNDKFDGYMNQLELSQLVKSFYTQFGKYAQMGKLLNGTLWYNVRRGKYVQHKDVNMGEKAPQLRFYDFVNNEFYQVNIDQFAFHRSVQRKFLYMYEINMTALKGIAGNDIPNRLKTLLSTLPTAKALTGLAAASAFLGKIKGFLQATNRFVGAIKSKIDGVLNLIKQITSIITMAVDSVKAIMALPSQIAKEFLTAMQGLMAAIVSISDLPDEFVVESRKSMRLAFALVQATLNNPIPVTPANDLTAEVRLFTNPQTGQLTTVGRMLINANDTIHTIAAKANMDWRLIVAANQLSSPFITTDFNDKFTPATSSGRLGSDAAASAVQIIVYDATIKAGDVLVIKTESVRVASVAGSLITLHGPTVLAYAAGTPVTVHEQQKKVLMPGDQIGIPSTGSGTGTVGAGANFEETLYWIDEALDETGSMVSDGDVGVKKGLSNLEMQLQHLIMTKRGELAELGHPEFGSLVPEFIGMVSTPVWNLRTQLECEMAVRQDPRVADVSNSKILVDGTSIYFEADVYPINQSAPMQISLPLS